MNIFRKIIALPIHAVAAPIKATEVVLNVACGEDADFDSDLAIADDIDELADEIEGDD